MFKVRNKNGYMTLTVGRWTASIRIFDDDNWETRALRRKQLENEMSNNYGGLINVCNEIVRLKTKKKKEPRVIKLDSWLMKHGLELKKYDTAMSNFFLYSLEGLNAGQVLQVYSVASLLDVLSHHRIVTKEDGTVIHVPHRLEL